MIIVVSSTGDTKHAISDSRFGRCAVFAVYDTATDTYSFIENKAGASGHGAGIGAAQSVADLSAHVVLTGNLGPKAKEVLDASGIAAFRVDEMKVEAAVRAYQNDALSPITSAGSSHKAQD